MGDPPVNAPPRVIAHAVDRPALRGQLDAGLSAPLSLVVAPAGAGKTVLLAQWAHARGDLAIAWLDITSADADVVLFSRRLVEAIDDTVAGFHAPAAPVSASERRLGESFLEEFTSALADVAPMVIVFEDLDRLNGTAVLTDLWRSVDLLPPHVHFVFSSRVDLQLGWSRHRLRYGLVEIRQRELAFDQATTARVIESITGRPVTEETAGAVTARTEGWAVGVQLTALSLRFAPDPERVVDILADTDRLVIDYLSEEVLEALSTPRRDTLTRIAVLDEVCAGLVRDVTGADGRFLGDLERDSLFIVPVPGQPGWYRFHRLFRDLLLLRLRAEDDREEPRLLEAAAQWYDREGLGDTAIEYLIRARRWDRVLDHVLATGRDAYEELRMSTVARWLSQVPAEVRAARPDAELLLALAEGMSGRGALAVDMLRGLLDDGRLSAGRRQVALAYLSAGVQFQPHAEMFAAAARRALLELEENPDEELPDLLGLTTRPLLQAVSQISLGRAHLFGGRLSEARRLLMAALESHGLAYRPYRVHCLGSLAIVEALSGRVSAASDYAEEALATADEADLLSHPAPADAYIARALVAIQRGEPGVGAMALAEGSTRAASNQRTQLMWLAHLAALFIDPPAVTDTPEASAEEPPGAAPPYVRMAVAALAMRRARLRGAPAVPGTASPQWSLIAFEEIAALLTLGQSAPAQARLTQLRAEADPLAPLAMIERELLLGWVCAQDGRRTQSRAHLTAAVDAAEPEWLVHVFIRAGPHVADLIEGLPGPSSEFRRMIVRRGHAVGAPRERRLADDLTPRERELLAYLPSRLTIADIAAQCFVSTNTIKTHMGHIYRKLGVAGRDAAIERATELGLIDPGEIARVG